MIHIKRALISCWNKEGIEELAKTLGEFGIEIISSGGTANFLSEKGIPVTTVEEITGYPSILGGRVKTLHPKIHAAILSAATPEHLQELREVGVESVQLVVVNLYPFMEEAVEKKLPLAEAIEYIDIGGPAMLRAGAKNFQHVLVLFSPAQYPEFMKLLRENNGKVPPEYSRKQAQQAFLYTAQYDARVHEYFTGFDNTRQLFPPTQALFLEKKADLRYGENPHQSAAVYRRYGSELSGMDSMRQLWGKPLSYNNYVDVEAAYALCLEFEDPAVAIIKHTNPCGAAVSKDGLSDAFEKALRGDALSAFGGIVACNLPVDVNTAERISKIFFECVIAPEFDPAALEILQKKKNLRLLTLAPAAVDTGEYTLKSLNGVFLLQEKDAIVENRSGWEVVSNRKPNEQEWQELDFAWKVVKHVKSNAIVFTKDREIYGVGAGQMSRVDSVTIAGMKARQAGRDTTGCVMASDAFFPFRDGIDEAAKLGIRAVIQPGGSRRDSEVIQAVNDHHMTMVFTGNRHFKH